MRSHDLVVFVSGTCDAFNAEKSPCIHVKQTRCFQHGPPQLNHLLAYSRALMVITVPHTSNISNNKATHGVKTTFEMRDPFKKKSIKIYSKRRSASIINIPLEPCMIQ